MGDVLNIPKKKNQFEAVPFVEEMTQHQLKVLVKRLWVNIQEMAGAMDENRPDVATSLDNLLDGCKVTSKMFRERFQYFQAGGAILEYDSMKNTINILDKNGELLAEGAKGFDLKEIKKALKKPFKGAKKS